MAVSTTVQIKAEDKTKAAFRAVSQRTAKLNQSFQGLSASLGGLKTALVGMLGIGALGSFSKDLVQLGDRLQKISIQTGLAVEEIEILQFAASQAGVGTDQFNASIQKFSKNIGEAELGAKLQADAFKRLGVSIYGKDEKIKATSELFVEVAESLSKIESPATKAKAASDLFGRTGVELLALLNLGAEGISDYGKKIREAGGIIGKAASDEFSAFNDQMDLLSRGLRGKFAPVLVTIIPLLTMLAENLDSIAKFAGIAAAAFIAAKLPAMFVGITLAVKGLTLAMMTNPLGLIATSLAAIAVYKGDEIMDAFGFAEEAPKDLKETNTKLEDTAKQLKKLDKIEEKRVKTAESFAKTTKKNVVPNLKKLEKSLKDSNIQFKNIRGKEGLGGLQLSFLEFFGDVQTHALNYLSDASAIVSRHLKTIRQDFAEMITGLQNQLVFRRNDISDAFADILTDFERELQETKIDVENINIEIPSSAFDFTNTFAKVPGEIFDFSAVTQSAGAVDSLVKQINSYSVGSRSVSRSATAASSYRGHGTVLQGVGAPTPYWSGDVPSGYTNFNSRNLEYDVPSISSSGTSSRSSGRSSMSSGSSALESTGGNTSIQVNIYDGTGQKISAYDSAIRVEINERASRYNEFPAMAA
jgi:ribosome recycling factor